MNCSWKILIGVLLSFSLSAISMTTHTITSRKFSEEDRKWAINKAVQDYLKLYRDAFYFIAKKTDDAKNKYELLGPSDIEKKREALTIDANKLLGHYLDSQQKNHYPLILNLDGKDVAGLFYRITDDNVLVIDEFILLDEIDASRRQYIVTQFLRNQHREIRTHKFFLRPINGQELSFFTTYGFVLDERQDGKKYGYDPILYLELTRTY